MLSLAEIIEPMPGKLAVLVATKDEITPNGLFIPVGVANSIHESKPTQGTVVAIGDESLEDAPDTAFQIDDVVIFGKYSGTEVKYQPDRKVAAQKIIILKTGDILARFRMPAEAENVQVKG